jgi:hypothetical protein
MTNRSSEAGSTLTVLGRGRKSRFLGRDIERRIETDRVRRLCNTTGSKLAWEDRVRGRTVGLRGRRSGAEEVDLVVGRKKPGVPNMPDRRVRAAVEGLHVRTLGTDHRVELQVAGNNVGVSRIRTVLWLEDR